MLDFITMHSVRQSNRGFGLTFAAVFGIIAVLVWWFSDRVPVWAMVLAAFFLVLALAAPGLLMPLNRLWAGFIARFSVLSNGLLLILIYYTIMLTTGLILRATGSDPMRRRREPAAATYWQPVTRVTTRETLRDLF